MAEKRQSKSIAQRAYELWEKAGKPHGRDLEHWFQAEIEVAKQSRRRQAASSNGPEAMPAKPARASKVTSIVKERSSTRKK